MKRAALVHPFLFALASLLYLYARAAVIAPPTQVLRPLALMWLVLAAAAWPVYRICRGWVLTALWLSIMVAALFCTPRFALVLGVLLLLALALWGMLGLVRRSLRKPIYLSASLSLIAAALVAFQIALLAPFFADVPDSAYRRFLVEPAETLRLHPAGAARDIYYIVLDAYARADILQDYYQYDNSEFVADLERLGFAVPPRSSSNYPKTALSVASTLNVAYVHDFAQGLSGTPFWWLMSPWIDRSRARSVLEQAGYKTVAIGTDWDITDNRTASTFLEPFPIALTDFEGLVLGATPVSLVQPALAPVASLPSYSAHRRYLEFAFQALADAPKIDGPKLIFAHILAPHPPFVFDHTGGAAEPAYPFSFLDANDFPGSAEQYRTGYVEQLQHVNRRLGTVIDSILKSSEVDPIIILQADHGPGMYTDFTAADRTCIRERFGAFGAYYLPGAPALVIPSDITPVNIFRIIFNEYFGANLELEPNHHYYYEDTVYIYRLVDVSSRLNESCLVSR